MANSAVAILSPPANLSSFPQSEHVQPLDDLRDVARCDFCRLVQFVTKTKHCAKCHKPLHLKEDEEHAGKSPLGHNKTVGVHLDIGAVLRNVRRAKHLSQQRLAARLRVPRTYISKIENGKAQPGIVSLERLAEVLDVSVGMIVAKASMPAEEIALRSDSFLMDEMLPYVASLKKSARAVVISYARELASRSPTAHIF